MKNNINTLDFLKTNNYWGRGIIVGSTTIETVVAYFIMGRSENSRNRYFYREKGDVAIAPFDMNKVEDPSLIMYYPIKLRQNKLIITNGDQTDTIAEYIEKGLSFEAALRTRTFEPDKPHYTPRISSLVNLANNNYTMSILKSADGSGVHCERHFYEYEPQPMVGRFVHTYEGDGNPLPIFNGDPKLVSIPDTLDKFTETIWSNLDDDNKISLCTMYINNQTKEVSGRILNKRMGD